MSTIDWGVLGVMLAVIAAYGIYKGRGSNSVRSFLLADRSMRWYTVAFAVMATQASAITFTSTPGQAYADGMRFVQFYFGLPLAMIILSITAVPIYHRLGVYTAYEYLERRFDAKTRVITTALFLLSRGLAAGMTIYAPSLVLSIMLGMDIRLTSLIIGGIIVLYSVWGGVKAVNHTDVLQFSIIAAGLVTAFVVAVRSLPGDVTFVDAFRIAGATGKLTALDFSFDFNNRYTFWSGLFGGGFVALAYFGTDQSQVQRYLTGQSVTQSRLGLLFNGLAKVPMQIFILLLGVMVFVHYQFYEPPVFFNPAPVAVAEKGDAGPKLAEASSLARKAHQDRRKAVQRFVEAGRGGNAVEANRAKIEVRETSRAYETRRSEAIEVLAGANPGIDRSDTNYVFLTFVIQVLPAGLAGLLFACIFAASMSSSSGELSALASTTMVDIYRRFIVPSADDGHYLRVSRIALVMWGCYAVAFSHLASHLGSLIEAVNILGSLFYGTMLGVFLLAFYVKRVGGTAVFVGALAGETTVLLCFAFTTLAWLWYNVVGCLVVVLTSGIVTAIEHKRAANAAALP